MESVICFLVFSCVVARVNIHILALQIDLCKYFLLNQHLLDTKKGEETKPNVRVGI